jgi:hypothetical protein
MANIVRAATSYPKRPFGTTSRLGTEVLCLTPTAAPISWDNRRIELPDR